MGRSVHNSDVKGRTGVVVRLSRLLPFPPSAAPTEAWEGGVAGAGGRLATSGRGRSNCVEGTAGVEGAF